MSGARRIIAFVFVAGCAHAPPPTSDSTLPPEMHDQKGGEPATDDHRSDAKRLYQEASIHYNLGEFAEAIEKYSAAYRLVPDPVFLYNLAQANRLLGNYKAAVQRYHAYLSAQPDAMNGDEVRAHVAQLEKATPVVDAPVPSSKPDPPPSAPASLADCGHLVGENLLVSGLLKTGGSLASVVSAIQWHGSQGDWKAAGSAAFEFAKLTNSDVSLQWLAKASHELAARALSTVERRDFCRCTELSLLALAGASSLIDSATMAPYQSPEESGIWRANMERQRRTLCEPAGGDNLPAVTRLGDR